MKWTRILRSLPMVGHRTQPSAPTSLTDVSSAGVGSERVICPGCGRDLPANAKFCLDCGRRLDGSGAESNASRLQQYIPKELLGKLEAAQVGGGMQGERRLRPLSVARNKVDTGFSERSLRLSSCLSLDLDSRRPRHPYPRFSWCTFRYRPVPNLFQQHQLNRSTGQAGRPCRRR